MKDTFVPSKDYITKKWYVIDATDQTLGRLDTKASRILVGKVIDRFFQVGKLN